MIRLTTIMRRHVRVRHVGKRQYRVELQVRNQGFSLDMPRPLNEARWMQRQLAKALRNLIEDNTK